MLTATYWVWWLNFDCYDHGINQLQSFDLHIDCFILNCLVALQFENVSRFTISYLEEKKTCYDKFLSFVSKLNYQESTSSFHFSYYSNDIKAPRACLKFDMVAMCMLQNGHHMAPSLPLMVLCRFVTIPQKLEVKSMVFIGSWFWALQFNALYSVEKCSRRTNPKTFITRNVNNICRKRFY